MRRISRFIVLLALALSVSLICESSEAAGRLRGRILRRSSCPTCGMNSSSMAAQSLFNGQDLTGWDGDPKIWSVVDGVIVGESTADNPVKKNTFLIWKDGTVDDFDLTFKYRVAGEKGNSGVQYRSEDKGGWVVHGYQADFETGPKYSGILYEEKGRGILGLRGEKVTIDAKGEKSPEQFGDTEKLQKFIKPGQWNTYHVVARGNHLIHEINGHKTVDVIDNDAKAARTSGILALQLHAGPPMKTEFKDIRLKRLAPAAAPAKPEVAAEPAAPAKPKVVAKSDAPAEPKAAKSKETATKEAKPKTTKPKTAKPKETKSKEAKPAETKPKAAKSKTDAKPKADAEPKDAKKS